MTTQRTTRRISALLVASLAVLTAGTLHAATVQGFEGGLGANESTLGDVSIQGSYNGISPASGTGQLLLTTINSAGGSPDNAAGYTNQSGTTNATSANFNTFFGLTPLDSGISGKEGSGYKIVNLFLTAGSTLSFDYDFMTQEPPSAGAGGNRDFAFYTLSTATPGSNTVITDAFTATTSSTTGANNPFGSETGYLHLSIPINTTGTYTFTLGVMDVGNTSTDDSPSALLVDNIQTNAAVPEPSTLGLIVAGAAALAGLRRRIRK